ncbi:hypothetical protein F5Y18DRAFT_443620 [Xylariaceae sp. FL1019]|nr:hypothetical protein F5Y18DRAFT_443620 [Xylariaceae sp. FL1019]
MKSLISLATVLVAVIAPSVHCARDPVNNSPTKPPGPVQPGAPVDNCHSWIKVTPGMTCYSLAPDSKITVNEFIQMNPQLKGDCQKNLWVGYSYCVKASGYPKPPKVVNPNHHATPTTTQRALITPNLPDTCSDAQHDKCQQAVFTASASPRAIGKDNETPSRANLHQTFDNATIKLNPESINGNWPFIST